MTQLRCTICAKSWRVEYFGNVRNEQQEHDRTVHPDLVEQQQAVYQRLERLFPYHEPERCSFCGVRASDRREHERAEHPEEFARASELTDRLKELDRHWHVSR